MPAVFSLGSFSFRKRSPAAPGSVRTAARAGNGASSVCRPRPRPTPAGSAPAAPGQGRRRARPACLVHAGEERTEPPPSRPCPASPSPAALTPVSGAPRARGWRGGRGERDGAGTVPVPRSAAGSGAGRTERRPLPMCSAGPHAVRPPWAGGKEPGELGAHSPFQRAGEREFFSVCGHQPTAPLWGLARGSGSLSGCSGDVMPIGVLGRSFFPLEHHRYLDEWGKEVLFRSDSPLCP